MGIDAYTTVGNVQMWPFPVKAPRDPVNSSAGIQGDVVGNNGTAYQNGQLWQNTSSNAFFIYQGQGVWVELTVGGSTVFKGIVTEDLLPATPDPITGLITLSGVTQTKAAAPGADNIYTKNVSNHVANVGGNPAVAVVDGTTALVNAGLVAPNTAQFVMDLNGFMSLKGATNLPAIQTVTGDSGGPVGPDASGNVNYSGGTYIKFAGTPGTNTEKPGVFFNSNTVLVGQGASTDPIQVAFTGAPQQNIGFTLSGGTLTITDAAGNALSATNIGYVAIPSPITPGKTVIMPAVNPYTVTDSSGTNDIGANLFGTTTAVAWGNDCPFYLYGMVDSTAATLGFGFSRLPNLTVAPGAGNIAVAGTTAASTQGSMFMLKNNGVTPTVANFASQQVVLLGSFRMQKSGANAWTIQALNGQDGINRFQENVYFTYPTGQNGASAVTNPSTHFIETAGFPTFTTRSASYQIAKNGMVTYNVFYAPCTADGTNATPIVLTAPLKDKIGINALFGWYGNTGATLAIGIIASWGAASSSINLKKVSTTAATLLNTDISGNGAASQLGLQLSYIPDLG